MSKKIFIPICLLLALFYTSTVFSQTVIDYQSWTGATGCNIFSTSTNQTTNVPATINGVNGIIVHQSNIGQPTYVVGTANNYVALPCGVINNLSKGTEYRILFNFKQAYSYVIKINAACIGGTTANLRLLPNNGGSATSTTCTGYDVIDQNTSGNLYSNNVISGGSNWQDYTYNYVAISSPQSNLNISAVPPNNSALQTILIRKITITETAPTPTFTLAPTTLSIVCGTTPAAKTFTVTNVYNSPNVTSYDWDLGSASNGWLYNGTPAPQFITGTSSSLVLTPSSANVSSLSNVKATVKISGTAYTTLTSTVSVQLNTTTYTIAGLDALCSGSTAYSITPQLPAGYSVAWSLSPATGIVSQVPSGTTTTLTKTGNGNIVLTAVVTGPCMATPTISLTKKINIGAPVTVYKLSTIQTLTTLCGWDVTLSNLCNATGFVWQDNTPLVYTNELGQTPPYRYLVEENVANGPITKTYIIAAVNQCGTGNFSTKSIAVPAPWRGGDCSIPARIGQLQNKHSKIKTVISPNPVTNVLTVNKNDLTGFNKVRIYDMLGTLKLQLNYPKNIKSVNINVSSFKSGIYQIHLFDGLNKTTISFSKL